MLTAPRAREGATRRNHAARPGAATDRPRSSTIATASRSAADVRSTPGLPAEARAMFSRAPPASGMLPVRSRVGLVGLHDRLHQLVAHDVAIVELHELDPFDVAADLHRLDQAGHLPARQIDLGDVAGDHRLGAEAET